jgi:hypothetical protein
LNPDTSQYREDSETNFSALADGGFGTAKTPTASSDAACPEESGDSSSSGVDADHPSLARGEHTEGDIARDEPISMPSPCPSCYRVGESLTAVTNIPHFKEVIIMSFTCQDCGYRDSEVKGGGALPSKGTETILTVESKVFIRHENLTNWAIFSFFLLSSFFPSSVDLKNLESSSLPSITQGGSIT